MRKQKDLWMDMEAVKNREKESKKARKQEVRKEGRKKNHRENRTRGRGFLLSFFLLFKNY